MDDNTFKLLSLALGTVSTLGLAYVGYLTAKAKSAASTARDTGARNESKLNDVHDIVTTTAASVTPPVGPPVG